MANTIVSANNRVIAFEKKFFEEYTRDSRYKRYMGSDVNSIINVNENLTKSKGDRINMPLVGALDFSGGANDGSTGLVGNEKALPNEGHRIDIGVVRDAVVVNVEEEQASAFDIANAGKSALKTLAMEYMREDISDELSSIDGVLYATATEPQKDTWLGNNADRVLFGASVGNDTGTHLTSLQNVDSAADKLTTGIIELAKRRAITPVNPASRPMRVEEDTEAFVMFVPSLAFRDLNEDAAMQQANRDARPRAVASNPIFRDGDLLWKNVIIREIPELPVLTGVGGAGQDVAACFLCKAQSIGIAWAQRTKMTFRKEDDYGFEKGVGFFELRGIEKLIYDNAGSPVDWGVSTIYVSGVADA